MTLDFTIFEQEMNTIYETCNPDNLENKWTFEIASASRDIPSSHAKFCGNARASKDTALRNVTNSREIAYVQ